MRGSVCFAVDYLDGGVLRFLGGLRLVRWFNKRSSIQLLRKSKFNSRPRT